MAGGVAAGRLAEERKQWRKVSSFPWIEPPTGILAPAASGDAGRQGYG